MDSHYCNGVLYGRTSHRYEEYIPLKPLPKYRFPGHVYHFLFIIAHLSQEHAPRLPVGWMEL